MKKVVLIAAAFVMAVCGGAASADEYRASSGATGPGYFSERAEDGRWVVGYTGDSHQPPEEIAEFALRRAGELAAEQHQEWFAVIGASHRFVEVGVADDLALRAGNFMGIGPSRQTFGGETVPMNVLERWQPRQARQTILVIQLGSGDSATFPGVTQQPQIFPAAAAGSAG